MWLWMLACVPDRDLLALPARFEASPAALTLEDGGTATLEQATWTIGSLRLEAPASSTQDTGSALLRHLSPISVAHAHPGHESAGGVLGELLGEWELDLLSDQDLGTLQLYEGELATGRLELAGTLRLQGVAELDGALHPFDLAVESDAEVTGLPLEAQVVSTDPPSALVLSLDPAHALSWVDLSADSDDDGLLTAADDGVENSFSFGALSTPTYSLTLEP